MKYTLKWTVVWALASFAGLYGTHVRSEPLVVDPELGTAFDPVSGLTWQDNPAIKNQMFDWKVAQEFCSALTIGPHQDWRLPNIYELLTTLANRDTYPNASVRQDFSYKEFSSVFEARFWSSTMASYAIGPFALDYNYGHHDAREQQYRWAVRCVRGPSIELPALIELYEQGRLQVHRSSIDKLVEEPEFYRAFTARGGAAKGLRAFLDKYPDGYYANNAKAELQRLDNPLSLRKKLAALFQLMKGD